MKKTLSHSSKTFMTFINDLAMNYLYKAMSIAKAYLALSKKFVVDTRHITTKKAMPFLVSSPKSL